jgi:hypothetical protein
VSVARRRFSLFDLGRRFVRTRTFKGSVIALAVLGVAAVVADRAFDRPLRRIVERRLNERLVGYQARVGRANFHLIGFALELERMILVQDAHPDPPVMDLPRLRMSVRWTDLLTGHLVADAVFESPRIHANLLQLQEENTDSLPLSEHGWQRALESIYPLKFNALRIHDGRFVYQGESDFEPLQLSNVELVARNIRNIRSKDRTYPSTFQAEARVFDVGRATLDGHADFLAEPSPGYQGRLELDLVELKYFEPIARKMGLSVKGGSLSGIANVEWGPSVQVVDLETVEIVGASTEYVMGAATPGAREAGQKAAAVAKESLNKPEVRYRVQQLAVHDGSLRVWNRAENPPYHLDFSHAYVHVKNVSSRAEDGPANVDLEAAFMEKGAVEGSAVFYSEGDHANVEGKVAIEHTPLPTLNNLLRAKGNFDVARGTLDLYTHFRVRDGTVDAWVKPLFRNVEVLDSEQDKHKNVFRKMYEGIIGGVAKLLRNEKGEVATVTTFSGPLDDPKANALQALGGLLRNAFVKAILPGFHDQIARLEPFKYRAALKKEKKKEKAKNEEKDEEERPR